MFLNPVIAIATITILGGVYWLIYQLARNKLHTIGTQRTTSTFQAFKTASEAMLGIKEIKLHNSEEEFIDRFALPSKKIASYTAQYSVISSMPRYLLEVIAFGGIVIITISVVAITTDSSDIIPMISLYAVAGYRLLPALQGIYSGISSIRYNMPAFNILIDDFISNINDFKRRGGIGIYHKSTSQSISGLKKLGF